MQKLFSVDWQADFGFLKKPDVNEGVYLTYNMLHKPALLGMLGAIAGWGGYGRPEYMAPERILEYRRKGAGIACAIAPLRSERGAFSKFPIKYTNTVGYANEGSTHLVEEQTLVKPAYRTWLLLDDAEESHSLLLRRLQEGSATYVPYLGKNEFPIWWKDCRQWDFEPLKPTENFRIDSVFQKEDGQKAPLALVRGGDYFLYIERLPMGFEQIGKTATGKKTATSTVEQYHMAEHLYTNFLINTSAPPANLYEARHQSEHCIIQLF